MNNMVNNLSFNELAEMDSDAFACFLGENLPNITENLKGSSPDQTRFTFQFVDDVLVLNRDQFNRFMPDFQAWQRVSHKAIKFVSVIPKPFRNLFKIEFKMTWLDDGKTSGVLNLSIPIKN